MLNIMLFFVICFLIIGLIMSLATGAYWMDRVIVAIMRRCHIYAYPFAIRLAYSLEINAEEWHLDDDTLQHPVIGKIKFRSHTLSVYLPDTNQSKNQVWTPNWIEHRIIRDSIDRLVLTRHSTTLDRNLPRPPW